MDLSLIAQYLDTSKKESVSSSESLPVEDKICYVTLLTNDSFFPGITVLSKTLKRHCKRNIPFFVLVGEGVNESTLIRLEPLCEGVLSVPSISCPYTSCTSATTAESDVPSWTNSEMTKLNIWNLTQFEKVVYIDADCMVMGDLDSLFDRDCSFAACPDVFPPDKFNAGVMVLRPNADVFEDMKLKLASLPSHDGGDTGFLNSYFPDWYAGPDSSTRLPFGYNAQRILHWFTYKKRPGYWESIKPLMVIHYSSSPKPWNCKLGAGDLEFEWQKEFMGI